MPQGNPITEFNRTFQRFLQMAPRIAGRYAINHFRDNIRRRGGVPYHGSLQRFAPRIYETRESRGKKVLLRSGNMADSMKILVLTRDSAKIGYPPGTVGKYAALHNQGGTIAVTPKMKKYFWAMYEKSGKQTGKSGGNMQAMGDAGFWKAMALKKTGSQIRIPKREFMRVTPDLVKGIEREFRAFLKIY